MNCDKCGKNMDKVSGGFHSGLTVYVGIGESEDREQKEYYLNQLGKYANGNKTSYNFCYECLIDAMMGRK